MAGSHACRRAIRGEGKAEGNKVRGGVEPPYRDLQYHSSVDLLCKFSQCENRCENGVVKTVWEGQQNTGTRRTVPSLWRCLIWPLL
jgi:hypothetical protein